MKNKKAINLIKLVLLGMGAMILGFFIFFVVNEPWNNVAKTENDIKNNNVISLDSNTDIDNNINPENKVEDIEEYDYNTRKEKFYEISDFDLSFLKLENKKENKAYSPLSIKYALKMLEEGSISKSRWEIQKVIGNREITKYSSNDNMSFANAFFIKDSYKNKINNNYIENLNKNYEAEVIFDSFETTENINSWVNNKTFKLIPNLITEENLNSNFILVNALAIDMDWKNKFLEAIDLSVSYAHEKFSWYGPEELEKHSFDGENQEVSGMEIVASINNYDIVSELGEENIKNTVYNAMKEWAQEYPDDYIFEQGDLAADKIDDTFFKYFYGDYNIEQFNKYWYYNEGYLSQLNSNYKDASYNTDFSLYVDNSVKVFAKDLKEYDGTTLQYVGIMPIIEELDAYIKNIDEAKINNIVKNLKELKTENFKDGVVTHITGFIPKFNFEYQLNLKEDLKQLGLTDIFEQETAQFDVISSEDDVYITDAIHQAVIEFTQDGIKAAAATSFGGGGGGDSFDYLYDVPVEKIDLTFDKPYMFLIRDKETGELWFVGTVYEPLSWENEDEYYK